MKPFVFIVTVTCNVPKLTQLIRNMLKLNFVADRYASTGYFTGPICSSPLDKLLSTGELIGVDGTKATISQVCYKSRFSMWSFWTSLLHNHISGKLCLCYFLESIFSRTVIFRTSFYCHWAGWQITWGIYCHSCSLIDYLGGGRNRDEK